MLFILRFYVAVFLLQATYFISKCNAVSKNFISESDASDETVKSKVEIKDFKRTDIFGVKNLGIQEFKKHFRHFEKNKRRKFKSKYKIPQRVFIQVISTGDYNDKINENKIYSKNFKIENSEYPKNKRKLSKVQNVFKNRPKSDFKSDEKKVLEKKYKIIKDKEKNWQVNEIERVLKKFRNEESNMKLFDEVNYKNKTRENSKILEYFKENSTENVEILKKSKNNTENSQIPKDIEKKLPQKFEILEKEINRSNVPNFIKVMSLLPKEVVEIEKNEDGNPSEIDIKQFASDVSVNLTSLLNPLQNLLLTNNFQEVSNNGHIKGNQTSFFQFESQIPNLISTVEDYLDYQNPFYVDNFVFNPTDSFDFFQSIIDENSENDAELKIKVLSPGNSIIKDHFDGQDENEEIKMTSFKNESNLESKNPPEESVVIEFPVKIHGFWDQILKPQNAFINKPTEGDKSNAIPSKIKVPHDIRNDILSKTGMSSVNLTVEDIENLKILKAISAIAIRDKILTPEIYSFFDSLNNTKQSNLLSGDPNDEILANFNFSNTTKQQPNSFSTAMSSNFNNTTKLQSYLFSADTSSNSNSIDVTIQDLFPFTFPQNMSSIAQNSLLHSQNLAAQSTRLFFNELAVLITAISAALVSFFVALIDLIQSLQGLPLLGLLLGLFLLSLALVYLLLSSVGGGYDHWDYHHKHKHYRYRRNTRTLNDLTEFVLNSIEKHDYLENV